LTSREATAPPDPEAPTPPQPLSVAAQRRATLSIAIASGLCSTAFNFYWPFLPLYLLEIGAASETEALFWVTVGTAVQGIARLPTVPIWGYLSDRYGRKIMFLRTLYFGSLTTLIMAFATEPWMIVVGFACQGMFSGFVPAAVALTSVSVEDSRLNQSLAMVTGAQYLGTTAGPALGALLAIVVGFQGAIFIAAALPASIAIAVTFFVPNDEAGKRRQAGEKRAPLEPFKPTRQFALIVFAFFMLFGLQQLLRLVTPLALKDLAPDDVNGLTGVAFALGGITSAISLLFIAGRFYRAGNLRNALVVSSVLAGASFSLLVFPASAVIFILGYALITLLASAMIPATNALIAANVARARRGTAFGIAGGAQALAFMTGPLGAALFGATSFAVGFGVMGALFVALGLLLLAVREPAVRL
jgi:DHA1 family multidrug resistance protein-like MFS transporter